MEDNLDDPMSQWNIQKALTFEIGNLFQDATACYRRGEIAKWFFALKAIKMRAINLLEDDERKSLATQEREITKLLSFVGNNVEPDNLKPLYTKALTSVAYRIENYSQTLSDYLGAYGLLLNFKTNARIL